MSKFIALLCAATVAVSASAVFAAETDTTSDNAEASATATAEASETATAEATAEASETAEATAEATETATAEPLPFTDIDADAYYADAVALCYSEGLFNGVSETVFSPDTTMTRAMFATVFARMEDADLSGDYELTFTDITDEFYAPYIAWATEQGIMEGYSTEEFGPNDPITREQAAKMLYSYMANVLEEELTTDETADYVDIDEVNDWAAEAIDYNAIIGYLLPDEDGNINPQDALTRADACYAVATVIEALSADAEATETPAATAEASEAPDASASPAASEEPDASASPAASEEPDASETPAASEEPDASETPAASATPAASESAE